MGEHCMRVLGAQWRLEICWFILYAGESEDGAQRLRSNLFHIISTQQILYLTDTCLKFSSKSRNSTALVRILLFVHILILCGICLIYQLQFFLIAGQFSRLYMDLCKIWIAFTIIFEAKIFGNRPLLKMLTLLRSSTIYNIWWRRCLLTYVTNNILDKGP